MIQKIKITFPVIIGLILLFFFSNNVFAQPANDNCYGSTTLTPGSSCVPTIGTVLNAGQSMPGCSGSAEDDVWYSFVANQSALNVQVSGSTGFNPVIQVFVGSCASLFSMTCVNNTGNGGTEIATLTTLTIGATYWVRVYDFGTTTPSNPTFTICVAPPTVMPSCATSTPAGNTCSQAAIICDVNGYCGSTSSSYTADSWPELSTAFCGSIENNSFIQFVANASTVSLNVWVTSSASNLGIQVMIFSANNCSGAVTTHTCVSPLAPSALPTAVTATGLTPGNTYFMMIDGYAGDVCNYVIGVNSGIQVSGQITTSATNVCLGTPVTLLASGGNGIYSWTPSPDLNATTGAVVIASPTTEGSHTYTMTTNSTNPFCPSVSVSNVTLNVFAPPAPNAGIDDTVCLGNPIYLTGTQSNSANTMSWQSLTTGITPTPTVSFAPNFSSLNPTVTVNQPGLYRFVLRENNSVCGINRDTVKVLVVNLQQTITVTEPSCFGMTDATIEITGSQAEEFSFDNGINWQTDSIQTGFSSGTYSVCSRNYLGCSVCSTVTINNPTPLTINVSNDTLICENGTATLTANAFSGTSFIYHWDFTSDTLGIQNVNPTALTEYTVYAENENGCLSLPDTIVVDVLPPLSGTITPSTGICPGYPTIISATATGGNNGPYQFVWSNAYNSSGSVSDQSVNPSSLTNYTVTITDGCETSPLILYTNVDVYPLPVPSIFTADTSICEPAVFNIASTTDGALVEHLYWEISNGQTFTDQEIITSDPLENGFYSVQLIVESPQGCIDSTTFVNFLTVYPEPVADFNYSPNPVSMFNTEVHLTNYSTNGEQYQWFIQDGEPSYSEQKHLYTEFPDGETGSYEVMLITTSEFGCVDSILKTIVVIPEILIYAPNTFTPNADEFNQHWGIYAEGLDIYNFNLKIYNRWGELIWESTNPSEKWDGSYNGQLVQQGIYTWTVELKNIHDDNIFIYNGHINVLP